MREATSPKVIFEIANEDWIAAQYLAMWMSGNIPWEEMLVEMAKKMEENFCHLADKFDLRQTISGEVKQIPTTPVLILEKSLIPTSLDSYSPIERQQKLITSILLIREFRKTLDTLIESTISRMPIQVTVDQSQIRSLNI